MKAYRFVLLSVIAVAGCSAPVAPEGFLLVVQFSDVNAVAIDTLHVTFRPELEMGVATGFEDTGPVAYEGGAITADVADDGIMEVVVGGDYVRSHLVNMDPMNPRFELEIWSDDMMSRTMPPRISAWVVRGPDQIATGQRILPSWPLRLGESAQINMTCRTDFGTRCRP